MNAPRATNRGDEPTLPSETTKTGEVPATELRLRAIRGSISPASPIESSPSGDPIAQSAGARRGLRVDLPAELPPLTPQAARALLNVLLTAARQRGITADADHQEAA